jgi:hypothetical protein
MVWWTTPVVGHDGGDETQILIVVAEATPPTGMGVGIFMVGDMAKSLCRPYRQVLSYWIRADFARLVLSASFFVLQYGISPGRGLFPHRPPPAVAWWWLVGGVIWTRTPSNNNKMYFGQKPAEHYRQTRTIGRFPHDRDSSPLGSVGPTKVTAIPRDTALDPARDAGQCRVSPGANDTIGPHQYVRGRVGDRVPLPRE